MSLTMDNRMLAAISKVAARNREDFIDRYKPRTRPGNTHTSG